MTGSLSRARRGATLLVSTCLAVAACSSSKPAPTRSGTAPPTSAPGGTATPATTAPVAGVSTGVTPTEIHVGALVYKSFYNAGVTGAMARIKRQNDAGGVYGRKIVLDTVADDLSSGTMDLQAARTLVQEDNVFALVPVLTQTLSAASYLEQAQVPFFGWSIQPVWCNLAYGFGFEGNDCDQTKAATVPDSVAVEQQLFADRTARGKTVALVATDAASAGAALKGSAAGWTAHGATVVLQDTSMPSPPAVVGDFTPFAEKILTSNHGKPPDLVETVMAVSGSLGLSKKLIQLGYHGIIQGFSLYDPRLASSSAGVVNEVQFEPFEANTPAVQQLEADVRAVDPHPVFSQPLAAGYWSADLFIAGLERAGPNLTRQSLDRALNNGFTYEVQGGTPPITWPQGHSQGSPCSAYVKGIGTGFTVVVPLTCAGIIPNPLLAKPS